MATSTKWKVGDRIGAVSHSDDDKLFIFGYGTYQGDEIPPREIQFMGFSLAEIGRANPKLVLDNGKVVWGCECWWGPEEKIKETAAKYQNVVELDIVAERERANGSRAAAA